MRKHILLEKAFSYPEPTEKLIPQNYTFVEQCGYWKDSMTGEIMMLSNHPCRPQTKKEDRETGEDQKGE